jgi:hypothetical protein
MQQRADLVPIGHGRDDFPDELHVLLRHGSPSIPPWVRAGQRRHVRGWESTAASGVWWEVFRVKRRGWRKTEAQLSVYPRCLKGAGKRPSRDLQDADIEGVEVKGEQAMSTSWPEEAEDAWLEEVGNPYQSMVAAAVTEPVVAAAFAIPPIIGCTR